MAVGEGEVEAPVEVGVEEEEAEGEAEEGRLGEPGRARVVDEGEVALLAVEEVPLAGEVADGEVAGLPPLEPGEIDPHPGPDATGRVVGDPGREADVAEAPLLVYTRTAGTLGLPLLSSMSLSIDFGTQEIQYFLRGAPARGR